MSINFDPDDDAPEDDGAPRMNTTPLIDVLLVLLVMLIITMPVELNAVRMDLPAGAPPPEALPPVVVRLEIARQGSMHWNTEPLADRDALQAHLQRAAHAQPQPEIHIHADGRTPYDAVAAALSAAQRAGLLKIGVVGLEALEAAATPPERTPVAPGQGPQVLPK